MKKLPLFPQGMNKRWWLFRPIDLITAVLRSRKPKKGLVVVRMDGLGDMILFRPVLDYYAQVFGVAKSEITVLGCHSWRKLADSIFAGFNVVTINEHAYERQFFYRLKISLWVARQHFKIAVCDIYFRKMMTCDSLLYYTYAQRIAVCEPFPSQKTKPRFDYYRHIYTDVIDTGAHPQHEMIRHYKFISGIAGYEIKPQPLSIPWQTQGNPITQKPYVAINFGSNEAGRRWPFEYYIEIAKRIVARGYYAVFLGGPAEAPYSDVLAQQNLDTKIINYIGKDKGMSDVFDIFSHAHATITSETGPGHVSLALHVPTLMICGGSAYITFTPFPREISTNTMHFVYRHRECFGCMAHCPYRTDPSHTFPCLADVTVEAVWERFEMLIPERMGVITA